MLKSIPFLSSNYRFTSELDLATLRNSSTFSLSTALSCLHNSMLNREHGVAHLASLCLGSPRSLALSKTILPCILLNTPWDSNLASTRKIKRLGSLFTPNTLLTFVRKYNINNNNCQENYTCDHEWVLYHSNMFSKCYEYECTKCGEFKVICYDD